MKIGMLLHDIRQCKKLIYLTKLTNKLKLSKKKNIYRRIKKYLLLLKWLNITFEFIKLYFLYNTHRIYLSNIL